MRFILLILELRMFLLSLKGSVCRMKAVLKSRAGGLSDTHIFGDIDMFVKNNPPPTSSIKGFSSHRNRHFFWFSFSV